MPQTRVGLLETDSGDCGSWDAEAALFEVEMSFQIEKLLALPLAPSFRVRIGPGEDDIILVDIGAWEANKAAFSAFCRTIPNIDGASWRIIKPYVGGNGTMARLLIALGEHADLWKVHPSPEFPELWDRSLHPTVLHGTMRQEVASKDVLKACDCCGRPMGEEGSTFFDLTEGEPGKCFECVESCHGDDCRLFQQKKAEIQITPTKEEVHEDLAPMDPDLIDYYLSQFDSER